MLNPWLILGSAAFAASFGISLLMSRDLGGSLIAGSTALATAFVTAAAVNWYHKRSTDSRLAALKYQIWLLQRQRSEEEQAVLELAAEKERVALALNSMQVQLRQHQLPGSGHLAQRPMLSWDLSAAPVEMVEVAPDGFFPSPVHPHQAPDPYLESFLVEATATRQKITASLNHLQAELSQLNMQVADHRQVRDQLAQEIEQLNEQRQQEATAMQAMQAEVEELERCRAELDQYVAYVEAKKRELETGSNPLQKALKQLQGQVSSLQGELRMLEQQAAAKRQDLEAIAQDLAQAVAAKQKQLHEQEALQATLPQLQQQKSKLEQEIAAYQEQQAQLPALLETLRSLTAQKAELEQAVAALQTQHHPSERLATAPNAEPPAPARAPEIAAIAEQIAQLPAKKATLRKPTKSPKMASTHRATSPQETNSATRAGGVVAAEVVVEKPSQNPLVDLPDSWTEFMVQLPDYELHALRAVVAERNALQVIGQIADNNFMAVDELLDSINQRAIEILGEPVVKVSSGFAPPAIVREHLTTIKRLIDTYEYLTE